MLWTSERIANLAQPEIEQLRCNAAQLGEQEIVTLCDRALLGMPKDKPGPAAAGGAKNSARARRLISRRKAFETRGVYLENARTSWSGVRKSDGMVVMSLWAEAIKLRDGACHYLLWSPSLPWYRTAAGRERLEHCRGAFEAKTAEGLLVYGEALAGHIPEDKARSVHGVDPQMLVRFEVQKHGEEYWAVWGRRPM